MSDLTSKSAIVTGEGRGIGAATARRLTRDGAAVLVADLTRIASVVLWKPWQRPGDSCEVEQLENFRAATYKQP